MTFDIILATDEDYGIGKNNSIPWNCPEDLQIFKNKTQNSILIVGRKTVENLPALKNRTIYCISKSLTNETNYIHKNTVKIFNTFEDALKEAENTNMKVFVAGGGILYNYVLDKYLSKVDTIHVTVIRALYDCDTYVSNRSMRFLDDWSIVNIFSNEIFTHFEMIYVQHSEAQYLSLVRDVLTNGDIRISRNSETLSMFCKHLKFDLRDGFPLLTTKKMFIRGIIEELLFFIRGDTNSKILEDNKVNIWKGNTSREYLDSIEMTERKEGIMGPMYGYQWRHFNAPYNEEDGRPITSGIDQLSNVIDLIKNNPTSRRILMTTYNPNQVNEGVLPPCHSIVLQFYVQDNFLDTFCYNRSSDIGLGLPFNIASSSLLIMIIAKLTNLTPRFFNLSLGDAHIYVNHKSALSHQINMKQYTSPTITIPDIKNLSDISMLIPADFVLNNYRHYPSISMNMVA